MVRKPFLLPQKSLGKEGQWHGVYAKAFVLTVVIFLLGVLVANYFSEKRAGLFLSEIRKIDSGLNEAKTTLLYFDTLRESAHFCKSFPLLQARLADRVDALGNDLTRLEEVDAGSLELVALKKNYTLLNAQLWLYLVNLRQKCPGANYNTVLYFYSNLAGQCPDCQRQGRELTELRQSRGNLFVFAFEANLGLDLIDVLKKQYGVTQLPAVVVNEAQTMQGYRSSQEIGVALPAAAEPA